MDFGLSEPIRGPGKTPRSGSSRGADRRPRPRGPRRGPDLLARRVATLRPVRHSGLADPDRVRRPGVEPAGHDRRDGRAGLRLSRQRPDLRHQRLDSGRSPSRSCSTGPRSRSAAIFRLSATARSSAPTARASPRRVRTSSGCRRRPSETADGWTLNGRKTWVTSGPVADLFVCYASTSPGSGDHGNLGVRRSRKMRPGFGWSARSPSWASGRSRWASWRSRIAGFPLDALLGREGRGAEVFNASMEWERGIDPGQCPGDHAPTA